MGSANYELGRFELNPITAVWLAKNLMHALMDYRSKFGALPQNDLPPETLGIEDVIEKLQQVLRDSKRPLEPPADAV